MHNMLDKIANRLHVLSEAVKTIKSGMLNNNETLYCEAVRDLAGTMECVDTSSILRYGIFLINSVKDLKKDYSPELADICFKNLQEISFKNTNSLTKEDAVRLYIKVLHIFESKQPIKPA